MSKQHLWTGSGCPHGRGGALARPGTGVVGGGRLRHLARLRVPRLGGPRRRPVQPRTRPALCRDRATAHTRARDGTTRRTRSRLVLASSCARVLNESHSSRCGSLDGYRERSWPGPGVLACARTSQHQGNRRRGHSGSTVGSVAPTMTSQTDRSRCRAILRSSCATPGGSRLSGYCDSYLNDSWILVR